MDLHEENRVNESKCLNIGDLVIYEWGPCIVIRVREAMEHDDYYALMDLKDGCYANGCYDSLEELTSSISISNVKHYSSDEYELLLRKKKKC
jgi:hypothetical protein